MREIKFRGKRLDNGEWVYGSLVNNPMNGCSYIVCNGPDRLIDPSTVGQLWQPSLNVKCYGGDLFTAICSVEDDGESDWLEKKKRIVKICESNSGHYVSVWHMGQWCAYKTMNFTSFVPIGNIHDNAELLK